jgi:hypothetical protein
MGIIDNQMAKEIMAQIEEDKMLSSLPKHRELFVFWQFNGDNSSFCQLNCPECYGHNIRMGMGKHYWNGRLEEWEEAFMKVDQQHGGNGIYFNFSYGETLLAKGVREVLTMIGQHQSWRVNIITNFLSDINWLLETKLAKEHRLYLVTCWHPEGVENPEKSWELFKHNLLLAKATGVPLHVMMVWFPPVIKDFPKYFKWLDSNNFRVSVRRFVIDKYWNTIPLIRRLPWVAGTYTLMNYSKAELEYLIASTSPKVVKYAVQLANTRGKVCTAGKDMILVKYDGVVAICAGCYAKRHEIGNIFNKSFKLPIKPLHCPINSCGGDFGMPHLVDPEFGSLPDKMWDDTFISMTEDIQQGSPVPYHNRIAMLRAVEEIEEENKR